MQTAHALRIKAICPEGGYEDQYTMVVIVTDRILLCEDIEQAVKDCTMRPIYQEALTQDLADRLDAQVETTGHHCRGTIQTTCTCEPKRAE